MILMSEIRIGFRQYYSEQIHYDIEDCSGFSEIIHEKSFSDAAEHPKHVHVEDEMDPVGVQESGSEKAMPFILALDDIWGENEPAHHAAVVECGNGDQAGDDDDGECYGGMFGHWILFSGMMIR